MAPSFQSSFIPKESPTQNTLQKKSFGLFGMLSILLLLLSIVVAVGLFVYVGMLKSNITSLKSELDQAVQNIDQKTITEMTKFSDRLNVVQGIVDKHQVVSNFLDLLAGLTVTNVEYNEFHYSFAPNGNVLVVLNGKARDYATVALQEDILKKNKYIKTAKFEDLELSGKGQVGFKLTIEADHEVAVYLPKEMQSPVGAVSTTTKSQATTTSAVKASSTSAVATSTAGTAKTLSETNQ